MQNCRLHRTYGAESPPKAPNRRHALLGAWLLAGACQSAAVLAQEELRVGAGLEYSTGDYGSVSDTNLWSMPVTGEYTLGALAFRASLPWLRLTGPGDVIPGLGQVGSVKGRRKGDPGTPSTAHRSTESGMGDLSASVTYALPFSAQDQLAFDVTGRIKVPTADEDKGLGTGEFDYAIEAGAYQSLGAQWRLTASLGYALLGSSDAIPLDNIFYGSLGAQFRIDERLTAGLNFALGEATSSFGEARADLSASIAYDLDDNLRLRAYVLKGFADGSPDRAVGMMVEMRF